MAYTPKQNNKTETTQTNATPNSGVKEKVKIAGSIHITAQGEKKGVRLCNLFVNEKDGKRWMSGKDDQGNRFSVFLND